MAFPEGWTYYCPLTIDADLVGSGGVTNFPVLVTEDDLPAAFWSGVNEDGSDIRFSTDLSTALSHELVSINTSAQTLQAWVKVPSLSSAADTVIYLHFGNAAATAPSAAEQQATWDNNYAAVFHLEESAAPLLDATASGNALALSSGTPGYAQAAQCGNGVTCAPAYFMDATHSSNLDCSSFTLEGWFNASTLASGWHSIVRKFFNYGVSTVGNKFAYALHTTKRSTANLSTGTWYHYCVIYDDTPKTLTCYLNGSTDLGWTATAWVSPDPSPWQLWVGSDQWNQAFAGTLDELRISPVARSGAWAVTAYNNQLAPATFYTVGAVVGGGLSVELSDGLSLLDTLYAGIALIVPPLHAANIRRVSLSADTVRRLQLASETVRRVNLE